MTIKKYAVLSANNTNTNLSVELFDSLPEAKKAMMSSMDILGDTFEEKTLSDNGYSIYLANGDLYYASIAEIQTPLSDNDIKNVGFRLKGAVLGKITSDAINAYGFDNEGYANAISNTHPTLQQNWMRMTMAALKALARRAETGCYDDRNEATVLAAKTMVDATKEMVFPYI